jgi:two-component sensor histidine kinase
MIHEKLYKSKDLSTIEFHDYVKDIIDFIFSSFSIENIQINIEMKKIFLNIETSMPLGLILNELVTNALKYGFNTDHEKVFSVIMNRENTNYILKVKNTGTPFPQDIDFRMTKSLGLKLVCLLTEQLNGTIELDRGDGTEFTITFPVGL